MIVINIKGGLGNQLFQYALGRHLALIHNTSLALDVRGFQFDPLRSFRLNAFNISAEIVSPGQNVFQEKILRRLRSPKNPFNRFFQEKLITIRENGFPFEKEILNSPDNIFLDGYWQSEKYFQEIASVIRSDLTLVEQLPPHLDQLRNQICNTTSVSLHVRRGDYASDPTTTAFHGLYSPGWYAKAAEEIKKSVSNPHFFIFSDDYEWVKGNLNLNSPCTFIKPSPDGKEAQDLYLMSQCEHNIIANSSFSWWAAWLNNNPEKKVIAPARWFMGGNLDTRDLLPDSWIRMAPSAD